MLPKKRAKSRAPVAPAFFNPNSLDTRSARAKARRPPTTTAAASTPSQVTDPCLFSLLFPLQFQASTPYCFMQFRISLLFGFLFSSSGVHVCLSALLPQNAYYAFPHFAQCCGRLRTADTNKASALAAMSTLLSAHPNLITHPLVLFSVASFFSNLITTLDALCRGEAVREFCGWHCANSMYTDGACNCACQPLQCAELVQERDDCGVKTNAACPNDVAIHAQEKPDQGTHCGRCTLPALNCLEDKISAFTLNVPVEASCVP